MNSNIVSNHLKIKWVIYLFPLLLLLVMAAVLYYFDIVTASKYAGCQKEVFLSINSSLGQYSLLQNNLTQVGDALVFLSFLSVLIVYAPKLWEALIIGCLVSCVLTIIPKEIFSIPRPAAVFDNGSFIIIGNKLTGHNSFPSGHSITTFTILTVLLFSFMPTNSYIRFAWVFCVVFVGAVLVSSRIGVGAHYPIDVVVGSIIGYISGLLGIFISRKYPICSWINNKRYYPYLIVLFLSGITVLIFKIFEENLIVFYLAFASLVISIYKMVYAIIKK